MFPGSGSYYLLRKTADVGFSTLTFAVLVNHTYACTADVCRIAVRVIVGSDVIDFSPDGVLVNGVRSLEASASVSGVAYRRTGTHYVITGLDGSYINYKNRSVSYLFKMIFFFNFLL